MEEAIWDRLGRLPRGLKTAYDEIYGTIQARNPYDRELADVNLQAKRGPFVSARAGRARIC